MIYFGIDPGRSGSISAVWDDGKPFVAFARGDDTEADLHAFLSSFDCSRSFAVIEKVSSSPQMGVKSAFTFGQSYGLLRGLLIANKIAFDEVSPQRWQKALGCMSGGDKNVTKAKAQQLFPGTKIIHANADSLLLAWYARELDVRRRSLLEVG